MRTSKTQTCKIPGLIVAGLIVCALLSGCIRSHEIGGSTLRLHIQFPSAELTPDHQEFRGAEAYSRRCIVELYDAGTGEKVMRKCAFTPISSDRTAVLDLIADEGTYDILVWSDFVSGKYPENDTFYSTESFSAITMLNDIHPDDYRYKDAAYAKAEGINHNQCITPVDIKLTRPLAAYRILTDDAEAYIALSERYPKKYLPLEDLRIEVGNSFFIPNSLNIRLGLYNNSDAGYHYVNRPLIEGDDVAVASDMIFATDTTEEMLLTITAYDRNGDRISHTSGLTVGYTRDRESIIKGNMLVAGQGFGTIIFDTTWEGDFLIYF